MNLKDAALESPDFLVSGEDGKFFAHHAVTCHMAAIFWAFRALGKTQKESKRALKAVMRSVCLGCQGRSANHGSLQPAAYGGLFCDKATPLDGMFMASDVLIVPSRVLPMHSMVVVGKTGNPPRPLIRGFNNYMTFQNMVPPPPYMRYDARDRDLATRVDPNSTVLYIKEYTYLKAALAALQAAGG